MKKLATLAVFYFLATNGGYVSEIVGPFNAKKDCDAVRAWTANRGISVSVCWEGP